MQALCLGLTFVILSQLFHVFLCNSSAISAPAPPPWFTVFLRSIYGVITGLNRDLIGVISGLFNGFITELSPGSAHGLQRLQKKNLTPVCRLHAVTFSPRFTRLLRGYGRFPRGRFCARFTERLRSVCPVSRARVYGAFTVLSASTSPALFLCRRSRPMGFTPPVLVYLCGGLRFQKTAQERSGFSVKRLRG